MSTDKRKYSIDEVNAAATAYFDGNEFLAKLWVERYALRDHYGRYIEATPDDMHHRLAKALADVEQQYGGEFALSEADIYALLENFRYVLPSGSILAGVENEIQLTTLSSCYAVASPHDSIAGILRTDEEVVQILKRRGGVGVDLSSLRPRGSRVGGAGAESPGFMPVAERLSHGANGIVQRGRQGALMLTMSVQHPDVAEFVTAKTEVGCLEQANLSVRVDDAFMQAVEDGKQYRQRFVLGDDTLIRKDVSAADLWAKIVRAAWQGGEPGLLFWDNVRSQSVTHSYESEGYGGVTTNPCAEVALSPYESCRLLSLNLLSYVEEPFTPQARLNYVLLRDHAQKALRLADDLVDLELEKVRAILEAIEADPMPDDLKVNERVLWQNILTKTEQGRRVGIGVAAMADMLAALGLPYAGANSVTIVEEVMRTIAVAVYTSSVLLAKERGAFVLYDAKLEETNAFITRLKQHDATLAKRMKQYGRRNMACLSVAPTGTISLLAEVSNGIEPIFKTYYQRKVRIDRAAGTKYDSTLIHHPQWQRWALKQQLPLVTPEELQAAHDASPYAKQTAYELDPMDRIALLAAVQRWVDSGVSVTINLPAATNETTISHVFLMAWQQGCKGVTVYREGTREAILDNASVSPHVNAADIWPQYAALLERRPDVLECDVVRFQNNKEKWVALIGLLDGQPYEIFTGLQDDDEGIVLPKSVTRGRIIRHVDEDGKRYDFQFENKRGYKTTVEGLSEKFDKEYWNYAKLISGVLRYRMPVENVIKLVSSLQLGGDHINTWKVGVERALKKYVTGGATELTESDDTDE
ncbi:MAG: adenosylcobalamin-dependent ribonucleoside-diphosphate reductase [Bacteroidales bacterium]|nr:adenosylcobalamin-dependent ribonucleoside-diphosphate reductase [Bacteroidales bacterium]